MQKPSPDSFHQGLLTKPPPNGLCHSGEYLKEELKNMKLTWSEICESCWHV